MLQSFVDTKRSPVWPCAGHGFNGIGHCDDFCFFADAVAFESVGIPAAIKALVMLQHGLCYRPREVYALEDIIARLRMIAEQLFVAYRQ